MKILVDLNRYAAKVDELTVRPAELNATLFYGSSTFAVWGQERLSKQMEPIAAVNHGFGGSTAEEALYYYHRLVKPYAPKALVWYEGDNDMPLGYSPEEAAALSIRVFEWAKKDFPGISIVVLPVKHCPARKAFIQQQKRYNELLYTWVQEHHNAYYIDTTSLIYTPGGELREDVYMDDMLHFNEKGYEELAALIRPALSTIMQEQWI